MYCSHTIEHLYPQAAIVVLREMRRVLSPEGVARVAVPSMEHAMRIAAGEADSRWPRGFKEPLSRAANYLFCDGQHRYAYTAEILGEFARESGFSRRYNFSAEHETASRDYFGVQVGNEPEGSLIYELRP